MNVLLYWFVSDVPVKVASIPMPLNHFSPSLGIPVAIEIVLSDTKNSNEPTLVCTPSYFKENYFNTSIYPLCNFWKNPKQPIF